MSGVNYMRFGMRGSAIMFWYGVFRFDKFRLLSWFLALYHGINDYLWFKRCFGGTYVVFFSYDNQK